MSKYVTKRILLQKTPNCPLCNCKMVVLKDNPRKSYPAHAAVLVGVNFDRLICFQCRRLEIKRKEIASLPFLIRWRIRIDKFTGIFSAIKKTRGSVNKWWYIKVCGNAPHGRA